MTATRSIRDRALSVVFAGTLALGVTCGGVALAAGPGTSAAGDASTDLGAALEQVEAGAAGSAPTVEEGVPSFTTVTQGGFCLQVSDAWECLGAEDEDGATYGMYLGGDGVLQVVTFGEGVPSSDVDEATDTFVASLQEGGDMADLTVTGTQDRKLDGMLVRDVAFTSSMEGTPCDGLVTLAFGADETAILTSVYVDDGTGVASFAFQQAHRSLAACKGAQAGGGAAKAPGAAGKGSGASAGTSAGSTAASTNVNVVSMGDFEYAIDIEHLVETKLTGTYISELEGSRVVGVPVTVTNVGTQSSSPDAWAIEVYGPDGMQQDDLANYMLDDSLMNVSGMRPGATTTAYVYLLDEGEGTYTIVFDDFSEQWEISVEL